MKIIFNQACQLGLGGILSKKKPIRLYEQKKKPKLGKNKM